MSKTLAQTMNKTKAVISLNNIKLAVFDFDDTLAVHSDREYAQNRTDSYYEQAYTNPEIFYNKIQICTAPISMSNLVGYCRIHNIKMMVLSKMRFSLHLEAKKRFVEEHYGKDIEFHLASTNAQKIETMKIFSKVYGADYNEILYVDDLLENVSMAREIGITAILPADVDELITDTGNRLDLYMDD